MRLDVRSRRRSKLLAIALVGAVLALVVIVGFVARYRSDTAAKPRAWGNAQTIGTDVSVEVNTSCGGHIARHDVAYQPSTVVLTVYVAGTRAGHCGHETESTLIHLPQPIGDRVLVDGACGDRPKPSANTVGC